MKRITLLFALAAFMAATAFSLIRAGEEATPSTSQSIQVDIAKAMRDLAPHRQAEAVKTDVAVVEADKEVGAAARNYYQFESSATQEARKTDRVLDAVGTTLGLLRKEVDDLSKEINELKKLPEDERDTEAIAAKEEVLKAKNTELRPLFGGYNREAHSKAYTLPDLIEAVANRRIKLKAKEDAERAVMRKAIPETIPIIDKLEADELELAKVRAGTGVPIETGKGLEGEVTLDLGGGITLRMVPISAGTFTMGSPAEGPEAQIVNNFQIIYRRGNLEYDETQHSVTIGKAFYLGMSPVTQAQYEAVMGTNPSYFKGREDSPSRPVEHVNWDDAVEFCRKVSEKTGRNVRLPTESEWEYACRAGTTTTYHTGNALSVGQANFMSGHFIMDTSETTPVGSFPANAWGLRDMHGNVWEWCADWYGVYPKEASTDPKGPENGDGRVLRGGMWFTSDCRSATRLWSEPINRNAGFGFRVALD